MAKAITIFNQKGGVGKTTTNINLGAALANLGKAVLMIDMDPQGNTTSGIGVVKRDLKNTIYDILVEDSFDPRDAVMQTGTPGLDIIPANVELAGAEVELVSMKGREQKLKEAIKSLRESYDYIFIDCPPSLGLLTINALAAVDSVLIPIQCEFYALEGVTHLMSTIDLVKRSMNPNLYIEGVILNMFDSRTKLSEQVVDEVKKFFGDYLYETIIPRNIRLAEAPSHGIPVMEYDPQAIGSTAYVAFAQEFLARESERK